MVVIDNAPHDVRPKRFILEQLNLLEQKQQPTADSIKRYIVQCVPQSIDFDKYLAIEKIEYLRHVARDL